MIKKFIILIAILSLSTTAFFARRIFSSSKDVKEYFTVYREYGELYFKQESDDKYSLLFTDNSVDLPSRSFIRTGKGSAHIVFPDKSMFTLGENSEVQVIVEEKRVITITQFSGISWHRVNQDSYDTYNVQTPLSIIQATNSNFGLGIQNAKVVTYVTMGMVDIQEVDKQGATATLNSNYLAELSDKEKSIVVSKTPKKIKDSIWYIKNSLIDTLYDNLEVDAFVKKLQSNEETKNLIKQYITDATISKKDLETINFGDDGNYEGSINDKTADTNDTSNDSNQSTNPDSLKTSKSKSNDKSTDTNQLPPSDNTNQDQSGDTTTDTQFQAEMNDILEYYISIPTNTIPFCNSRYKKKDVDAILNELTAIEDLYNKQHSVADLYRNVITLIKESCDDDNVIDLLERNEINYAIDSVQSGNNSSTSQYSNNSSSQEGSTNNKSQQNSHPSKK